MAALEDLDDPGDDSALDHICLCALTQTELLQRSQRILSQVGIIAALSIKRLDEHGNDVVKF